MEQEIGTEKYDKFINNLKQIINIALSKDTSIKEKLNYLRNFPINPKYGDIEPYISSKITELVQVQFEETKYNIDEFLSRDDISIDKKIEYLNNFLDEFKTTNTKLSLYIYDKLDEQHNEKEQESEEAKNNIDKFLSRDDISINDKLEYLNNYLDKLKTTNTKLSLYIYDKLEEQDNEMEQEFEEAKNNIDGVLSGDISIDKKIEYLNIFLPSTNTKLSTYVLDKLEEQNDKLEEQEFKEAKNNINEVLRRDDISIYEKIEYLDIFLPSTNTKLSTYIHEKKIEQYDKQTKQKEIKTQNIIPQFISTYNRNISKSKHQPSTGRYLVIMISSHGEIVIDDRNQLLKRESNVLLTINTFAAPGEVCQYITSEGDKLDEAFKEYSVLEECPQEYNYKLFKSLIELSQIYATSGLYRYYILRSVKSEYTRPSLRNLTENWMVDSKIYFEKIYKDCSDLGTLHSGIHTYCNNFDLDFQYIPFDKNPETGEFIPKTLTEIITYFERKYGIEKLFIFDTSCSVFKYDRYIRSDKKENINDPKLKRNLRKQIQKYFYSEGDRTLGGRKTYKNRKILRSGKTYKNRKILRRVKTKKINKGRKRVRNTRQRR